MWIQIRFPRSRRGILPSAAFLHSQDLKETSFGEPAAEPLALAPSRHEVDWSIGLSLTDRRLAPNEDSRIER
jgi:hypothetical protein